MIQTIYKERVQKPKVHSVFLFMVREFNFPINTVLK